MGSPISPIVAYLYMENCEVRALCTSPNPPLMWKRFVDDTSVVMKKANKEEFLTHLNSVDKTYSSLLKNQDQMAAYHLWTY